jgi:hypothetical protein
LRGQLRLERRDCHRMTLRDLKKGALQDLHGTGRQRDGFAIHLKTEFLQVKFCKLVARGFGELGVVWVGWGDGQGGHGARIQNNRNKRNDFRAVFDFVKF